MKLCFVDQALLVKMQWNEEKSKLVPLKSSQISQEIFKKETQRQVFCNEVGKIFKNTFCLASHGPDLEIRKKLDRNRKKQNKKNSALARRFQRGKKKYPHFLDHAMLNRKSLKMGLILIRSKIWRRSVKQSKDKLLQCVTAFKSYFYCWPQSFVLAWFTQFHF